MTEKARIALLDRDRAVAHANDIDNGWELAILLVVEIVKVQQSAAPRRTDDGSTYRLAQAERKARIHFHTQYMADQVSPKEVDAHANQILRHLGKYVHRDPEA